MKEATLLNFTGSPVCHFKLIFLNCWKMCIDNFLDWVNAHMVEMVCSVSHFKDFIILGVVSG